MKFLVPILFCAVSISGMHQKSIYMKKLGLSDLQTSASGYIYHGNTAGPVSYIQFNPGLPKPYPTQYRQGPLAPLKPILPLEPLRYPKPVPILLEPKVVQPEKESLEIVDDDIEEPKVQENYEESGKGEANNSGYHSQNGEKSVSDYNKLHAYDQGQKGSYENEGHKGNYLQKGGDKKGYFDSSLGYASHHDEGKASKGGNFAESGYHKKGQKTTGYHNVYHKDEYKKDHTFYDESDRKGHFSKYDNADRSHQSASGGHKEGGRSASGFRDAQAEKQGFYNRGRNSEASSGHKSTNGQESFQNNNAKYGENGDRGEGRQYGYILKQK